MKIINHKTMAAGAQTRPRSSTIDSDATSKPSRPTATGPATALNGSSMAGPRTRPRSSTIDSNATIKASSRPTATNLNNAPLNDNPIRNVSLHGSPKPLGAAVFTDVQVPNTADGNKATLSYTSNNKTTILANILTSIGARYRDLINGAPKTSSIAATAGSFDTDGAKTRALWAIVANAQPRYREGEETETETEMETCRCGQCNCPDGTGECTPLGMWMMFMGVFGVVWAVVFVVLWVVVMCWVL